LAVTVVVGIISIVVSLFFSSEKLDQAEQELKKIQSQLSDANEQIDQLEKQMQQKQDEYQQKIDELNSQIAFKANQQGKQSEQQKTNQKNVSTPVYLSDLPPKAAQDLVVYLTFDDGPNYHTGAILDYLKEHDVKATFFVVPHEHSEMTLNRIVDEGHGIAVHCYSHEYSEIYASVEAYLEDFNKARNMIHEQTGVWTDIYRFPGGSINNHNGKIRDELFTEMRRRGFVYYDWNVDSGDTSGASESQMITNVPGLVEGNIQADNRAIVLFHDKNTSWVIDDIIEALKDNDNDYTFAVIDGKTKPMQWQ